MIKLHERTTIVKQKRYELDDKVLDFMQECNLTDGELLSVLTEVFSSSIRCISTGMIRVERHGDASKPGDEE